MPAAIPPSTPPGAAASTQAPSTTAPSNQTADAGATPSAVSTPSTSGGALSRFEESASPKNLREAATSPLADLNIVHAPIPPVLRAARNAPYEIPADRSCQALGQLVQTLDAALGADLDTVPPAGDPGLVERGASEGGNAAVGAVRSAAEGLVPHRAWVRKLTGAERYSREVAAAIAAGTIRRAYLKGLGEAAGCGVPAAPRTSQPQPKVGVKP